MKRLVLGLVGCLGLISLAPPGREVVTAQTPAYPGPTVAPPPIQTPSPNAIDQLDPDIVYFEDRGQYLLVWSEDRGAGHRIYAKRLLQAGTPLGGAQGGEYELTGATAPGGVKGDQRWPTVSEGIVAWSEQAPGATHYDLYAQRLTDNGRTIDVPRKIVDTPSNQRNADLVRSTPQEWLVVWSDDASDAGDILGLRITDALLPLPGGKPVALVAGAGMAEEPEVHNSSADLGYFTLVWTDDRAGNRDIFMQSISRTLVERPGPRGKPVAIVASPNHEYAPDIAKIPARQPAALVRPPVFGQSAGTHFYYTVDVPGTGTKVIGQRLRLNGYPLGPAYVVAPRAGVHMLPAGALSSPSRDRYFVVWMAKSEDAADKFNLYGTEVDPWGTIRRAMMLLVAE